MASEELLISSARGEDVIAGISMVRATVFPEVNLTVDLRGETAPLEGISHEHFTRLKTR